VDFRPASVRAAEIAIELSWAFGSRVSLLHVLEPMPTWPVSLHQQREWVTTLLNEGSDRLVAGKAMLGEIAIEMGFAADVIVRYAQETEADHLASNFLTDVNEACPRGLMVPSLDLSETNGTVEVRMDLPGIKVEEIDVQLTENLLTVSAHCKEEKEEKGKTYHRMERHQVASREPSRCVCG